MPLDGVDDIIREVGAELVVRCSVLAETERVDRAQFYSRATRCRAKGDRGNVATR